MKTKLISLLSIAMLLFSCESNDAPAEKVDPKILTKSYDYEGCSVKLDGYIVVSSSVSTVNDNEIGAYLKEEPTSTGREIAYLRLKFSGKNSIWIPKQYNIESLKITDNDGKEHKYDQKVTIEGVVYYTDMDWRSNLEPYENDPSVAEGVNKARESTHKLRMEREKKDSEIREKETGDPNNYNFEIKVTKITPYLAE